MRAETLRAFERHLVAAAARPQTIATYLRIARVFFAFLSDRDLNSVDRALAEAFLARPRRTAVAASTSTRNLEIVALRALFRALGGNDPTQGLRLKPRDRRQPDVPTTTELAVLFEHGSRSGASDRVLAVLALLFQAGLRVHELVALDVEQVDLGAGALVGVAGKNATRYEIPLGPEAIALVGAWLERHPTRSGPLFPSTSPRAARASVRSVQRLVARLRRDAGLAKRITPHSLRHATATEAIRRGTSLPDTQALMRHARPEQTFGYVALASDARRQAATRIGAAIPRSLLPPARNPSENPTDGSVGPAVDAKGGLCDIGRPEHDGRGSRKTGTTNTPKGACFRSEPASVRVDGQGGDHARTWLKELLDEHLDRVREVIAREVARALARRDAVHGLPFGSRPHD